MPYANNKGADQLVSVAEQASLSVAWSQTPEDRFSRDEAHIKLCEASDDHEGSVSIRGWRITNFRFADDVVNFAEEEEEAGVLVDHLDTTITRYKMEIGPDKMKVKINNPNGFQREIKMKSLRLEAVKNFKHLGASISNPRFFPG